MRAPDPHPTVRGYCPACGGESLFLGSGGYVTCAASTLLGQRKLDHARPAHSTKEPAQ